MTADGNTVSDEQQIRAVMDSWLLASRAGDLTALLNLMTEDVVFLTPGNIPMLREQFEDTFKSMAGVIDIDGRSDIQEITVIGDTAICWNLLEISVTPQAGGPTIKRAGNTLTVFHRGMDGQWRIWRDANMLAPV